MALTVLPAMSIVAPATLPTTAIGAVTICVHPESKIKVMIEYSANFFIGGL